MTHPAPHPVAAPSPASLWHLATRSAILAEADMPWCLRRYAELLREYGYPETTEAPREQR